MLIKDGYLVMGSIKSASDYIQYLQVKAGNRDGMVMFFGNDDEGRMLAMGFLNTVTVERELMAIVLNSSMIIVPVSNKKGALVKLRKSIQTSPETFVRELGMFCGFPKCCVDYYVAQFEKQNYNLTLKLNKKVLEHLAGSPFVDCFWRMTPELGARNGYINHIAHIPCSPNCEESLVILERNKALWEKTFDKSFLEMAKDLSYRRPRRVIT